MPAAPASPRDLLDRAAISDTLLAYATGIDQRDWPLYRSIFTDEVGLDFTTWSGQKHTMPADDWVASVCDTLACSMPPATPSPIMSLRSMATRLRSSHT